MNFMLMNKISEEKTINDAEILVEGLEIYLRSKLLKNGYRFLKRTFDLLLSVFGLIVFSPAALVFSVAIIIEDGFPVLYRQARAGKDDKHFNLLKFRSMEKGSDKKGPVLVQVNDLRVTKVGRIMRALAMDELPQIWNILLGDLSFVGPRPERPELIKEILIDHPAFAIRTIVKPGLTGVAQVYGNYDSDPYKKIKYDLFYIQKWNFWLDIKLLFKSVWITLQAAWNKRNKRIRFLKQKARKIKNILGKG